MVAPVAVSPASTIDPMQLVELEASLRSELLAQRLQATERELVIADLIGSNDADSALARDLAERAMNVALDVVAEIEHALERIATASYGTCVACGDAIAPARLEALPYARTCVSCPPETSLRRG